MHANENGPALQWFGPVDLTADELCGNRAAQVAALRPRERAAEFLKAELAKGPKAVSELERLAAERGIGWWTLKRVKERSPTIISSQHREGNQSVWYWRDSTVLVTHPSEFDSYPEQEAVPGSWSRIHQLMTRLHGKRKVAELKRKLEAADHIPEG